MRFSSSLRGLACAAAAALPALSGCASPVSGTSGAINTGTFPNLNIAPPVAGTQFTPYSLAQHNERLGAAKQDQENQTAAAAETMTQADRDAARLRRLSDTHGQSTLDDIEGGAPATPAAAN